MSEQTADIVVTTGADFTITIDIGTIPANGARLVTPGKPDRDLKVALNGREITVTDAPPGDSTVSFALIWPPRVTRDSTLDLKAGSINPASAKVEVADPKPTVDNGDTPGFVELFGK